MLRSIVQALALEGDVIGGALHRTAFSWRPIGVETLLGLRADPRGTPRLLGAACFGCSYEPSSGLEQVIDLLVGAGLDPNDEDENGFRPLHTALSPDNYGPGYQESDGFNAPASLALIRNGASTDIVFHDAPTLPLEKRWGAGFTGLHAAALHGSSEVVIAMLADGVDPSVRSADGRTALDLARSALAELTGPDAWKPAPAPDDASPSQLRRAAKERQRWAERVDTAQRCVKVLADHER